MKAIVFLLFLANLLFYAFSEGYLGRPDKADAGRVDQQVAPERMRVMSRGEAPQAKPSEPVAPVEPAKPVEPSPVVAAPVVENVCLRWEHLAAVDGDRLAALLGEKFTAFKASKKLLAGEGNGWWVFIPPLPDKAEAEKKAGQLRNLGVTDYFTIYDAGPNRFAISLGVFSSEKGAQDRLAELKESGVKSARVAVRPGKDSFVTVDANGPALDKAAVLTAAKKLLPKIEAQDCK